MTDPIADAKARNTIPASGTPCRTVDVLSSRISDRKPATDGEVPGHGGDVWWVSHPDGSVGAYTYTDHAAGCSATTTRSMTPR